MLPVNTVGKKDCETSNSFSDFSQWTKVLWETPATPYAEVSWCMCNVDDFRSDYIALDWLHIAYKLVLDLCSLLLARGRSSSLTIIHPSIFISSDRRVCNSRSVMCWSIWTLSPKGKQKNTPLRFPCGPYSLYGNTKTPTLLPLSPSSVKACFVILGFWSTCNMMLVSVRRT